MRGSVQASPRDTLGMSPSGQQGGIQNPLFGLREQLVAEFGQVVRHETIDQVAEEAFADFEDARIREFVSLLAWRRARAHLLGLPDSTVRSKEWESERYG